MTREQIIIKYWNWMADILEKLDSSISDPNLKREARKAVTFWQSYLYTNNA